MAIDQMDMEEDQPGLGDETAGYSSRQAGNPYTAQLNTLLEKYLTESNKAVSEKAALLEEARKKITSRQAGPSDAETAFRMAAAFGKPTRTGSFFEGLSGVNETLAGVLRDKREGQQALEDLNLKYGLLGAESRAEQAKGTLGLASTIAKMSPKERMTEVERLSQLATDKNADPRARAVAEARLRKLTYIAPTGGEAGGKPLSPAGKMAADEGYQPGSADYQARVRQIVGEGKAGKLSAAETKDLMETEDVITSGTNTIRNMQKALELNPIAYEGVTAGARQTAGRATPIVKNSKAQVATTELETVVLGNTLDSLKTTFGGNPTEGERKILVDLNGSINKTAKEREAIYKRAMTAAARRVKAAQERAKSLKSGYFSGQGDVKEPEQYAEGGSYNDGSRYSWKAPVDTSRPIMENRDGSFSTEETITIEQNGKYYLLPTIVQGRRLTPDAAVEMFTKGVNRPVGIFDDPNEADEYAKLRSETIGNLRQGDRQTVRPFEEGGSFTAANVGRAAAQGLGLGFGDEAIAAVRAKMENRPYDEVLAEERSKYKKFSEEYPVTALGTEFAAGAIPAVASMFVPGGQVAAPAAAGRMSVAAGRLAQALPQFMKGQTAKLAGIGGASGAVAGAGTSEGDLGDRAVGAVGGGATGAVVAPALAKGLSAGQALYRAGRNAIQPSQAAVDRRATEKVLQAMERDKLTPDDVRARIAEDQRLGVQSSVADVSPAMKDLAEGVTTLHGAGAGKLGKMYEERLASGRENVGQRAFRDLAKGQDYSATESSLMSTLRSNADEAYEKAYSLGEVNDPRIMAVLENDTFKEAYKKARKIAETEAQAAKLRGEDPSKYQLRGIYEMDEQGNPIKIGEVPDVRTLDYIKRGMDAIIDKGFDGQGLSKAEAGALRDLKKVFVKAIDENAPEYAAARAKYAGDAEVLDALRLGKDEFLKPKMLPEDAKKLVAEMSEGEREALRTGVAQSILTKITEAPQQINAAQRIIGAPATRKRLEALFEDPAEYKVFEAALERESELFRNAQQMVRNSRTANKQEALRDLRQSATMLDVAGEMVDLSAGSPGSMIARTLKFLRARTNMNEATADKIADMLKAGSTKEVDQVMNALEQQAGSIAKQQASRQSAERAAAYPIGALAGKQTSSSEAGAVEDVEDQKAIDIDAILRGSTGNSTTKEDIDIDAILKGSEDEEGTR